MSLTDTASWSISHGLYVGEFVCNLKMRFLKAIKERMQLASNMLKSIWN